MRKFFLITGYVGVACIVMGVLINPEYAASPVVYIALGINILSIFLNGVEL